MERIKRVCSGEEEGGMNAPLGDAGPSARRPPPRPKDFFPAKSLSTSEERAFEELSFKIFSVTFPASHKI